MITATNRSYSGPEDDSEEESEFTLTELKAKATEKARLKLEEKLKNQDASKEETEEVSFVHNFICLLFLSVLWIWNPDPLVSVSLVYTL